MCWNDPGFLHLIAGWLNPGEEVKPPTSPYKSITGQNSSLIGCYNLYTNQNSSLLVALINIYTVSTQNGSLIGCPSSYYKQKQFHKTAP